MLANKKIMSPIDNYLFESLESFELFVSFKLFISFKSFVLFESLESFVWMRFNMSSFNSLCEKDFDIFSSCMNLFLRGFNAASIFYFVNELCMLY